jgi:N-acetylmuramate 1-kinase
MAGETVLRRFLSNEQATAMLGEDIALALRPGDVIALRGDLGAGKTSLARSMIRALAADPDLEVPSPTFTLVQSYPARLPVQHFDLYRLASPDELDELGLNEVAQTGVTIIEWPERTGERLPRSAIEIRLDHEASGRWATITAPAAAAHRFSRMATIREFLDRQGWAGARRAFLQGDASTRAYETIALDGCGTRILMNAPKQPDGPPVRDGKPYSQIAHLAESVTPFVALAKALKSEGFCAPQVHAEDLDQGLLILEHLGREPFLDAGGEPVGERYAAAAELLAAVHTRKWPDQLEAAPGLVHTIPAYDRGAMMIEVELVVDWYLPAFAGRPVTDAERESFARAWTAVLERLGRSEKSLVLRDFHSPNLIWRADRRGMDRIGVLDFQDALIGPSAFDVASLAQDARVSIAPDLERATIRAYKEARLRFGDDFDNDAFDEAYAIMAAQRNSKILGIFVRLDQRDGKPQYLQHLPRIRAYVARALTHPALAGIREFYLRHGIVEECAG